MKRVRPKATEEPTSPSRTGSLCKFCDHYYVTPCDEAQSRVCPNTKVKKKSATKRAPK